ncbi:hypothetical protein AAY473_011032 [Plecturocebus cupreus]
MKFLYFPLNVGEMWFVVGRNGGPPHEQSCGAEPDFTYSHDGGDWGAATCPPRSHDQDILSPGNEKQSWE